MSELDEGAIAAVYEAALAGGRWEEAMGRLGEGFGAASAFLFTSHSPVAPDALLALHNLPPGMVDDFQRDWAREDAWAHAAARQGLMRRGTVVVADDLLPAAELRRTRYYNEFLRGCGIEAMLGSVLFDGSEDGGQLPMTHLCWYRPPGAEAFGAQQKRRLAALLPHLQRALRLHWRMRSLAQQAALGHEDALARRTAALVLDDQGRVLQANEAGRALLDGRPAGLLRHAGGRLRGLGDRSVPVLDAALPACRDGVPQQLLVQAGGALLNATVAALPAEAGTPLDGHLGRPRCLLLLELPDEGADARLIDRVARLFGFTPAERRVVALLVDGLAGDEIAQQLGTSPNTVRTQIKSVLAKTGDKRQIDLVRRLGRLLR